MVEEGCAGNEPRRQHSSRDFGPRVVLQSCRFGGVEEVSVQSANLSDMTVARASELIQRRAVSPLELTQQYLERIERLNPRLNAYVTVTAERALADARRATEEIAAGQSRGPLHGVPIGLKDLYDTAGIPTEGGAKILAGRVPSQDCTVARKLREAGTTLLGKLNTHELAWGTTTNNPYTGATHNPWNLDYVPGGSSGGSGAAIAAGLATATMGTDTGGSIRIPAAWCGVVGLKPTYGRVSKAGVLPLSWLYDHPGPITRTVEDAAMVLQAIAGYDPADHSTVRTAVDDYLSGLRGGARGIRVGVPRSFFFDLLDDDVRAAVEEALRVLRGLGADVRDVEIPALETLRAAQFAVAVAESKEYHLEALRTRPQDFGPDLQAILLPDAVDGLTLAAALRARHSVIETARQILEEVDVLITPTMSSPALPIGEKTVRYGDQEESLLLAAIRLTLPFNQLQFPAISVPCGFSRLNLPIGLQIAGRPFDEAMVLRVGHAYEQATDWHLRHPAGLG